MVNRFQGRHDGLANGLLRVRGTIGTDMDRCVVLSFEINNPFKSNGRDHIASWLLEEESQYERKINNIA